MKGLIFFSGLMSDEVHNQELTYVCVCVCVTCLCGALCGPSERLILEVQASWGLSRTGLCHHTGYIGQRHRLTLLTRQHNSSANRAQIS